MATRQWSLTDHVSVENGSPTVTAEAAVWLVTAKPGNGISFDGGSKYYEILTVDSNTQITLADDFAETTISDGSVLIDNRGNGYTPAEVEVIQLYKDVVLNQIDLFQTTGKPPDTRGGDGSIAWDGPNRVWYQKTNGAWGDPQNLGGADGMDAGFKFKIDKSSISMADPGPGKFRLNNPAAASVTAIAFDDISADFGSPDVSAYLATWAQSTNTVKGHLIFHEVGATQNFLVYAITGLVDNTGWTQVNVSHVASGGAIDDGDDLAIAFIRAGDKGDPGVQAGFRFKFATMTGMVDPGSGFLRFNSNTYASITAVAISDLCAATGNPNVSASILSWDNSGNTENKGVLRIAKQDAEQTFIELAIVGTTTDNEGWSQLNVQYLSGNGTFATNDQIVVTFYRTGDDGWSPVFSIAEDDDRRVLEVTDWTGGAGTKPAINKYVGTTGFVDAIEDAIDIRGPTGPQGEGIQPDAAGTFANRATHDDEAGGFVYLSTDGDGGAITVACIFIKNSGTTADWSDPSPVTGLGGPDSSVDGNLSRFSGTTGRTLEDSGISASSVIKSLNGNKLDPYTGQVATRCRINTSFYSGNKQMMARSRHFCRDDVSSLQLVFANWYVDNSGIEQSPGAAAAITASIEYPEGVLTQVKFSGSGSGSIANGANIVSDACSVRIPKGAEFWVRAYYTNTAGVIFNTLRDSFGGEASNTAASGINDQTMSGTVTSSVPTATANYCPVAIIGTTTVPSVILIGDSRVEHGTDVMNAAGYIGNLERSIAPLCATINCGKGGEGPGTVKTNMTRRAALGNSYCKYAIIQEGINDINLLSIAGATVAASIATMVGQFTIPTYTATIEPVSTSTDNWATVANQTPMANEAQRVIFNNAIRAGIAGAAGYFEIADFFEPSRNSGKWKADGTAYGYTGNGGHASRKGQCYLEDSGIVDPRIFFPNPAQIRLPATIEQAVRGDASDRQVSAQIAGCKPLFKVHKNGTDQTGITTGVSTQLTWSYVVLDQGGYFDLTNNAYVPPAGFYRLVASVTFGAGIVDQNVYDVLILKNGGTVGFARSPSSGTNGFSIMAEALVQTNGSDVFTVNVIGRGTGDKTVAGLGTSTTFYGNAI